MIDATHTVIAQRFSSLSKSEEPDSRHPSSYLMSPLPDCIKTGRDSWRDSINIADKSFRVKSMWVTDLYFSLLMLSLCDSIQSNVANGCRIQVQNDTSDTNNVAETVHMPMHAVEWGEDWSFTAPSTSWGIFFDVPLPKPSLLDQRTIFPGCVFMSNRWNSQTWQV